MRCLSVFAAAFFSYQFVVIVEATVPSHETPHEVFDHEHAADFLSWKRTFGKTFLTIREEEKAFGAFVNNHMAVTVHNQRFLRREVSYEQDVNMFADRDATALMRMLRPTVCLDTYHQGMAQVFVRKEEVPDNMTWHLPFPASRLDPDTFNSNGWAVSATRSVEAQLYRKSGEYRSLAMQELAHCTENTDRTRVTRITRDAFDYIESNGMAWEINYHSVSGLFSCLRRTPPRIRISGYHLLSPRDEENLKRAVALIGPISVSIRATAKLFFYKNGVFYDPMCINLPEGANYAVLLVGYGVDPLWGDYWIIQTHWGPQWGENGSVRVARNKNNHCGIASAAIYPRL